MESKSRSAHPLNRIAYPTTRRSDIAHQSAYQCLLVSASEKLLFLAPIRLHALLAGDLFRITEARDPCKGKDQNQHKNLYTFTYITHIEKNGVA